MKLILVKQSSAKQALVPIWNRYLFLRGINGQLRIIFIGYYEYMHAEETLDKCWNKTPIASTLVKTTAMRKILEVETEGTNQSKLEVAGSTGIHVPTKN